MTSLYNRPSLLLCLTALFWAGNFIVGRAVVGVIPPVTLACVRWMLATVLILPVAWPFLKSEARALRGSWPILVFLGVLGPGSFNTLSYLGLVSTEAVNALVLNSAGPMFIALGAWLMFGDRVTAIQLGGMAAAFLGVVFLIAKGDPATLASLEFNAGDLLLVLGLVIWSVYTAFLRKRPDVSWQSFSAVTFAVAGLANLPFAAMELAAVPALQVSWPAAASLLYVAIFPGVLAYIFYARAVALIGPARTGIYLFLVPVFGTILATVFLGEKLHGFHAIGFALILAGVTGGAADGAKLRRDRIDASLG